MTIKSLSKELSLKLGDPVTTGNEDGAIYSSETRRKYLERALIRLKRMLKLIMRGFAPEFANSIKTYEMDLDEELTASGERIKIFDSNGRQIVLNKPKEVFVEISLGGGNKIVQANYVSPDKYYSIKFNVNSNYNPSIPNEEIYYTVIDNEIRLLPVDSNKRYIKIFITTVDEYLELKSDEDIIDLDYDYKDLLLDLAAAEGMVDIDKQSKHNLILSSIAGQTQIIDAYVKLLESKMGANINGE